MVSLLVTLMPRRGGGGGTGQSLAGASGTRTGGHSGTRSTACRVEVMLIALQVAVVCVLSGLAGVESTAPAVQSSDPRNILMGITIASAGGFYDMSNIRKVALPNATERLLVTLRHSGNSEGGIGEQEFSTWSDAGGAPGSWSSLVPLEPEQMLVRDIWRVPSHVSTLLPTTEALAPRIYAVYMWNAENITLMPDGSRCSRNDDMGEFALKYSDNGGASWSKQRWGVPLRSTAIDRSNTYGGAVHLIYSGARSVWANGQSYVPFTKFRYCCAETNVSESFALVSDNVRSAASPAEIRWRLLPAGERGLGVPGGGEGVAEEAHLLTVGADPLRMLMIYRTALGKLGSAYSSDGGEHFEPEQWLPYDPLESGHQRLLKNPRGSFTPWRSESGLSLSLSLSLSLTLCLSVSLSPHGASSQTHRSI